MEVTREIKVDIADDANSCVNDVLLQDDCCGSGVFSLEFCLEGMKRKVKKKKKKTTIELEHKDAVLNR